MCKLSAKIRVGNALCATGSGGAIVSSTPLAAAAAEVKGAVVLGMSWNEVGILVGAVVGIAGLIFGQYWAWRKHLLDKALIEARVAAIREGRYAEQD